MFVLIISHITMVNNVSDVTDLSSGMLIRLVALHVLKHSYMTRFLVNVYVLVLHLSSKMEDVDLVMN